MKVITRVLETIYGVGPVVANPTTCLWAAERVVDEHGAEFAKAELRELNRLRHKNGVAGIYPPFGHVVF